MKSVQQKAKEFCDYIYSVSVDRVQMEKKLVTLLKEQDRDTRHACAEAVLALPHCHTNNDNAIYDRRDEIVSAVSVDDAHDACMNVRAV